MDRRERYDDPEEALRVAMEGSQSRLWTALPGIIVEFDAARLTANIQPAISGVARTDKGTHEAIQMPLLLDCPVVFPGGGGVTLTFPLVEGDECLVVFSSRCIDSWWQLGGVQGQAELRMHDLSDGFCIPGGRSQPRKFNASTSKAQLRTDDGATMIELSPGLVEVVAPTKVSVTSPDVEITGNVTITGNLRVNGVNFNTHVHSGVQTGSGNSGTPV